LHSSFPPSLISRLLGKKKAMALSTSPGLNNYALEKFGVTIANCVDLSRENHVS
jgi:hypothetical protein